MKRLLIALGLGTAVFAAVFAAAATLGLTADDLGADDQVVASCDESVNVTYQTAYDAGNGTFDVTSITLANLDAAACQGQTITAVLSGPTTSTAALTTLTQVCCTGTTATDTEQIPVTAYVNPKDVTAVHVVITGLGN